MKYDLTTSYADNKNYFAKILTIPKLDSVFINTFNMVFEVYYVNAYNEPIIQKYALALLSNSVRLTKFQDINKLETTTLDTVGYVVNSDSIDIYIKSITNDASVYINILGVSNTDYSIKHHYAKFESEEPTGIVYATLKENLVTTINDLNDRLLKTNATRTLSGTVYHSTTTADVTIPEINRNYFGIVCDSETAIAFIYVFGYSNSISVVNIGSREISATLDIENKCIKFSNLSTNRFFHYIMNFSY